MNYVGKILVVLIFIMSLVFMSFAVMVYATHRNWKAVVERRPEEVKGTEKAGLRHQLQQMKEENEALTTQLEKLESQKKEELAVKIQALTELNDKKSVLEKEQADLIKDRDDLSKKEKEAVAALDTASQNLKELTAEVGTLREEIRKTLEDRDKQFARVVKLTDDIHKAQQANALLEERKNQMLAQVTHARKLLAQFNLDVGSPLDREPPPLRGKVLAINNEKMVEISLGSDDGLTVNHEVDVFRGAKYVGRLVVLTTATDKSVAKIDVKVTKTPVQVGDDVATKLRVSDQRAREPEAASTTIN